MKFLDASSLIARIQRSMYPSFVDSNVEIAVQRDQSWSKTKFSLTIYFPQSVSTRDGCHAFSAAATVDPGVDALAAVVMALNRCKDFSNSKESKGNDCHDDCDDTLSCTANSCSSLCSNHSSSGLSPGGICPCALLWRWHSTRGFSA